MKKHIVITVVLLIIGIAACAVGAVICSVNDGFALGNKLEYTEYSYDAETAINAIDFELKGDYNFIIQSGESCSLQYSQNELSTISVSEEDGLLKVVEKTKWMSFVQKWFTKTQKTDLILTVTEGTVLTVTCEFDGEVTAELPAWEYGDIDLEVNGSSQIKTAGEIKANDVNIDISGQGELSLNGEFKDMEICTSGGSSVNVQGSASSLYLSASGSMAFKSNNLVCNDVTLRASGSVVVDVKGEGNKLDASVSGSCRLSAGEFTLSTAELKVSGSANVTVNASNKIIARVSGSGKVNYYGDPQIEKSVSGSAQFNKIG